jgi:hypothetical protein
LDIRVELTIFVPAVFTVGTGEALVNWLEEAEVDPPELTEDDIEDVAEDVVEDVLEDIWEDKNSDSLQPCAIEITASPWRLFATTSFNVVTNCSIVKESSNCAAMGKIVAFCAELIPAPTDNPAIISAWNGSSSPFTWVKSGMTPRFTIGAFRFGGLARMAGLW